MKLYAYKFNGDLKLFVDHIRALDSRADDMQRYPNLTGATVFTVFVDTITTNEAAMKTEITIPEEPR